MSRPSCGLQLFALLMLLSRSSSAVHNDATESDSTQLPHGAQDEPGDGDTNHARNSGRRPADPVRNGEAKWLRAARYIYMLFTFDCFCCQRLSRVSKIFARADVS